MWGPSCISDQSNFRDFCSTNLDDSYLVSSQWDSVQEKKQKTDFQDGHHGGHLGFPTERILAIDLPVIPMLSTKFRINWPFSSLEAAKNTRDVRNELLIVL